MPVFDFHHSESGETISVLVRLDEPDEARRQQIVDGKVYKRVFSAPLAAKDTRPKDATSDDYRRVTEGKNLKVGEMQQISEEMSRQRAEREGGIDPVKEKFYQKYEKDMGFKHTDVVKREQRAKLRERGIRIED